MNNREYNHNGQRFIRIDKKRAKRAYNNGLTVIFAPVNLHPFNNYFNLTMDINKNNINCDNQPFETIVNAYEMYNCTNETGKYTAFYIPIQPDDFFKDMSQYDYSYMN